MTHVESESARLTDSQEEGAEDEVGDIGSRASQRATENQQAENASTGEAGITMSDDMFQTARKEAMTEAT